MIIWLTVTLLLAGCGKRNVEDGIWSGEYVTDMGVIRVAITVNDGKIIDVQTKVLDQGEK